MAIKVDGVTPLLQVFDMPTSLKYYRDVIGFEVIMQSSPGDDCDWCCLKLDNAYVMLNTAYEQEFRPASQDSVRVAAHEDTGLYFTADPDEVYEHLRHKGLNVGPPKVAPHGMKQLYLRDPDGYVICFQCPAEQNDT